MKSSSSMAPVVIKFESVISKITSELSGFESGSFSKMAMDFWYMSTFTLVTGRKLPLMAMIFFL